MQHFKIRFCIFFPIITLICIWCLDINFDSYWSQIYSLPHLIGIHVFSRPREHHQSSASPLLSRLCYLGEDYTVVWCFPLHAAKSHSPCPHMNSIPHEICQVPCSSTMLLIKLFHHARAGKGETVTWPCYQERKVLEELCRFWQISPHSAGNPPEFHPPWAYAPSLWGTPASEQRCRWSSPKERINLSTRGQKEVWQKRCLYPSLASTTKLNVGKLLKTVSLLLVFIEAVQFWDCSKAKTHILLQ